MPLYKAFCIERLPEQKELIIPVAVNLDRRRASRLHLSPSGDEAEAVTFVLPASLLKFTMRVLCGPRKMHKQEIIESIFLTQDLCNFYCTFNFLDEFQHNSNDEFEEPFQRYPSNVAEMYHFDKH